MKNILVFLLLLFQVQPEKHYHSSNVQGTIESIHTGGRTEVVNATKARLELWNNEWVLYTDVVQPIGRKGYFGPVLMAGRRDGKINNNQLTECEVTYSDFPKDKIKKSYNFRCANIIFNDENKPVSIHYTHHNFYEGKWTVIATYIAKFEKE